jgi:predicted RNA binding protein YcfA (HicA-like mRNA interferase family)
MSATKLHKEVREVVAFAATHGFEFKRFTGSGHIKLQHGSGAVVIISATPGKYTWRANAEAEIRRSANKARPES